MEIRLWLISVSLVLVKLFCLVLFVPPVPLELFPPRMSCSSACLSPERAQSSLQRAQGGGTALAGLTWARGSQVPQLLPQPARGEVWAPREGERGGG